MKNEQKIGVLIVEDSLVAREMLRRVLESDPQIEITGCARDGAEAIRLMAERMPDVITMDIHMPGLDGFETTRQIMETQPVPIVIVSASFAPDDVEQAFRAMEAGAVAAVEKPRGIGHSAHDEIAGKLLKTVRAMSEVRVVRRWPRTRNGLAAPDRAPAPIAAGAEIELVAIGASTGGPPVLHTIFAALPKPFPVPILVVQHISAGFLPGLAEWLSKTSGLPIHIAEDGERPLAGNAYLAPDGMQMRVGKMGRLSCVPDPHENGLRPAVCCLFRSVGEVFRNKAVGILLTGMGRDGAAELRYMRDRGAVTFAQDKESSVVHGMPGEAVNLGGAVHVLPPERIAAALALLVKNRSSSPAR